MHGLLLLVQHITAVAEIRVCATVPLLYVSCCNNGSCACCMRSRLALTLQCCTVHCITLQEYKETIESLYADPVTQAVRQEMKASP
jgi:hypothetical protein